jgi:excisionase family DNA binding protein
MFSQPLLTTHDVAEILRVNEATVRAWIKARDLRAFHIGREWRVAQGDLERFLDAHANRRATTRPPAGVDG